MIRVILVDDEPFLLQMLESSIAWEQYGMSVIGTFYNGKQALEYIRAHESSRAGFAGSRAKADGAIRMKTNRRRSIRNRRRFRCLYRKTGNPQAIRSNPVKQISFTDSGVFE